MTKVKRQHYVPKCYLINFAIDEKLYVYDKALRKTWGSPIQNISSERYFYDIKVNELIEKYSEMFNEEEIKAINNIDEQKIEKYFSEKVEGRYAKHLKNIITTFTLSNPDQLVGRDLITKDVKYDLSILLAFQFVRTREFRESMIQSKEVITKKIFDLWADAKGDKDLVGKVDFEFRREFEAIEHAQFIMDFDTIEKFGESLFNHIWMFAYNPTGVPLYTSDNPLVKRSNIEHPFMSYNGIASKGIELALPINSQIILMMYEKEYFYMLKKFDRKLYSLLNKDNVTYFNSMQVNDSYRQVYSRINDFSLAMRMSKENKHLKNINYKRLTIN